MGEVGVEWRGSWVFDGADSKGMPIDVDGRQEIGAKPSDLLPVALAACSATDVVQVLGEGDGELESLSVRARATQDADPPWAFRRIRLHYEVAGRGLTDEMVADAIRRSEEEMCSVAATLRGNVAIESTFELRSS
jgi:putative redox protein